MTDFAPRRAAIERALQAALETDAAETEAALIAPVKALLAAGGKRWRPLLLVLCAEGAAGNGGGADAAFGITPLVEFTHTASLIHDDIEDGSALRRGLPAAHIAHGLDAALNAASWLYFKAAECIERAPFDDARRNRLYALHNRALRRLHRGQAMDIAWHRDAAFFPGEAEYLAMAHLKTGALAALAAEAGLIAGGGASAGETVTAEAGRIAAGLGAAFQMLDDAKNLTCGNPGKERGDDAAEGKKSYVLVRHLREKPGDAPLIAAYLTRAKREGAGGEAAARLTEMVTASGAAAEAEQEARARIERAAREFEALLGARGEAAAALFRSL